MNRRNFFRTTIGALAATQLPLPAASMPRGCVAARVGTTLAMSCRVSYSTGYIYCPYIPLTLTRIDEVIGEVTDENPL